MIGTPRASRVLARSDWLCLFALTAVGAVIRLYNLGYKSLWFDEAATYHLVQGSWTEILQLNALVNSAPPLFPLMLGAVTGPEASEAALRMPSMVASVAGIPLTFFLVREFSCLRWSMFAAFLVMLSPTQIEYAQQVREYSLSYAAAVVVLIAYSRFLTTTDVRQAIALSVSCSVALLIQYGLAILLLALGLIFLMTLPRRAAPWIAVRSWTLAQLPALGIALWLVVGTLPSQLAAVTPGREGYLSDRYWDGTFEGLGALLLAPQSDIVFFAFPGRLMLMVVVATIIYCLWCRTNGKAVGFLLMPIALTVGASLAGVYPFGAIRQDMYLLPMIYVFAALGLSTAASRLHAHIAKRSLLGLAVAVICAFSWRAIPANLRYLNSEYPAPMRPTIARLMELARQDDGIYVYHGAVPAFRYYWRRTELSWKQGIVHWSGLGEARASDGLDEIAAEITSKLQEHETVWVVFSQIELHHLDYLRAEVGSSSPLVEVVSRRGAWLLCGGRCPT